MRFRWIDWNIEHLAQHGVDPVEAESVVTKARAPFPQGRSDGKYVVWGPGRGGRLIQIVYVIDEVGDLFVIHGRPLGQRGKNVFGGGVNEQKA
ncbi:MAG: hypothetical protein ACJ8FY_13415 [Gemmataceae bacterium]